MGNNDFMRNWMLGDIARSARVASGRKDDGWGEVLVMFLLIILVAVLALVFFPDFRETARVGLEHVGRAIDGALS